MTLLQRNGQTYCTHIILKMFNVHFIISTYATKCLCVPAWPALVYWLSPLPATQEAQVQFLSLPEFFFGDCKNETKSGQLKKMKQKRAD